MFVLAVSSVRPNPISNILRTDACNAPDWLTLLSGSARIGGCQVTHQKSLIKRMSDVCIYIYMYMLYIYTHMIVHIQYYMFSLSFSLHIIRICMNMTFDVAVSSVRPSLISNKLRTDVHNKIWQCFGIAITSIICNTQQALEEVIAVAFGLFIQNPYK